VREQAYHVPDPAKCNATGESHQIHPFGAATPPLTSPPFQAVPFMYSSSSPSRLHQTSARAVTAQLHFLQTT
jgi:hypothetical protein